MKAYLKLQSTYGIIHIDIPEWDIFEFFLILMFPPLFKQNKWLQWWLTIMSLALFLHMVI
eukprot:15336140-Ditylum_brightwellii.AAC.1